MKTIGLIGGMSWESTAEYYRIINELVRERLGSAHSAKIAMYSVDFQEVREFHHNDKWDEATDFMIDAAKRVERSGADFALICTNTMHKMADAVAANIGIPLLHIVDATASKITAVNIQKLGLLGSIFTMEEKFYKDRLSERYGLETIVPDKTDQKIIDTIIFEELCMGKIKNSSRDRLKLTIDKLVNNGAEGVILGCTELPLLAREIITSIPLFDTTAIHAEAAVNLALKD
jgi:aspartate racemase